MKARRAATQKLVTLPCCVVDAPLGDGVIVVTVLCCADSSSRGFLAPHVVMKPLIWRLLRTGKFQERLAS